MKNNFKWHPFSRKQSQILTWWQPNRPMTEKTDVVLEGSVRSGKTISSSFSFVLWAMKNFDAEEFSFCGKTIGAAIRNVINPLKRIMDAEEAFSFVVRRASTEGYHLDIQAFDLRQ